jgi:hypothetical protein
MLFTLKVKTGTEAFRVGDVGLQTNDKSYNILTLLH